MVTVQKGRPYARGVSDALITAAKELMITEGYSALSVDRLTKKAGTTRPTFYSPFNGIADIALTVIRKEYGVGAEVDTGSIATDILALQNREVEMLSTPLVRKNLTGILEAIRQDSEFGELFAEQFVKPRRRNVHRVPSLAQARGKAVGEVSASDVCDALLGPLLVRAVLPGSPPLDAAIAETSTRMVLAAITT
ncbi:TetR/AcrR family transcriptional regulator [Brevibacterium sp. HMSC063G07]|uniref:TetR/AcrR family transcriptional regulator n=1 Tax=Brevibacterium sp. HMSC063G07 TaxID=1739261 RepID=UPI0008A45D56|nr:TetR/AcrR family transcriptional regulator [Brevibacterium sp. HMSC063G07]OFL68843.1 hypothetical protein HMPREF2757_06510 [Brevibacterium sp. HMSC063G07]